MMALSSARQAQLMQQRVQRQQQPTTSSCINTWLVVTTAQRMQQL
jgi:hypothetical protein